MTPQQTTTALSPIHDGSIFPVLSLDRAVVRWEEHLHVLTPVQHGPSGMAYKREDAFAPLGYGGINGAKLRQLVWLVHRARAAGARGLVTGASVLSPQLSMTALVARHYGLPLEIVLGGTSPQTAVRHENVRIAADAGARFHYARVGYNPALQKATDDLLRERPGYAKVCYGITTPPGASGDDLAAFHLLGARQTQNVPPATRTLYISFGSANSATSVLWGLAAAPPPALRRVVLLGIGPLRLDWMEQRLERIERASGARIRAFYSRDYTHQRALQAQHQQPDGQVLLEHHDLHTTGFARYHDRMPRTSDGIVLHPTYEGKMIAYMEQRPALFPHADALFWIVGSAPTGAAMQPALAA